MKPLGLGLGLSRKRGVGGAGPINTAAPAITGTLAVGQVLTCSTGTWTGTGVISYAYQWRRNGANIGGATASTHTVVVADEGTELTCRVTATDDLGSRSATSSAVNIPAAPAAGAFSSGFSSGFSIAA